MEEDMADAVNDMSTMPKKKKKKIKRDFDKEFNDIIMEVNELDGRHRRKNKNRKKRKMKYFNQKTGRFMFPKPVPEGMK